MALPASDAFTSAGDSTLQAYSASWTINSGAYSVNGTDDEAFPNASSDCIAHWNADTFGNDQYAEVVFGNLGTYWSGAGVRAAVSAASTYGFWTDGSGANTELFKIVTGTWTQLGSSGSVAWAAGNTLRIEASGTTITPYRNGSVYSSIGAQTDSALSSGYGGMTGWGQSSRLQQNNTSWAADNLSSGVTVIGNFANASAAGFNGTRSLTLTREATLATAASAGLNATFSGECQRLRRHL